MLPADDDKAVVLCMRLDEPGTPVADSVIDRCRCGSDVWVAMSTFERAGGLPVEPVCDRCITSDELKPILAEMRRMLERPETMPESMKAEWRTFRRDHPDEAL